MNEIHNNEEVISKLNSEALTRKTWEKESYPEVSEKIELLEQRLQEMINSFDEMRTNLKNQVEASRYEEARQSELRLESQRDHAMKHAIGSIFEKFLYNKKFEFKFFWFWWLVE